MLERERQLEIEIKRHDTFRTDYDQRMSEAVAKIHELQGLLNTKTAELNESAQVLAQRTARQASAKRIEEAIRHEQGEHIARENKLKESIAQLTS